MPKEVEAETEADRQAHAMLERTIAPLLHPDFFFVNIGANDGVTKDPIYRFLEQHPWRGIAVEPVPFVFERLKANLSGIAPQVTLVNAAISDEPRQIWVPPEREGPFWNVMTQIGSFDRELAANNLHWLGAFAERFDIEVPEAVSEDDLVPLNVECISFDELMEQNQVDHIDLLNIDAEGADFEILMSIDLSRFCPTVLVIELSEMTKPQQAEVRRLLRGYGLSPAHRYGPFTAVFVRSSEFRRR